MPTAQDLEAVFANMTIADLARLGNRSVSEVAAYALAGVSRERKRDGGPKRNGRPKSGGPKSGGPKAGGAPKGDAETRTRNDKTTDIFADRILAALQEAKRPLRSSDLEAVVGGTTEIRRYVLRKLERDKQIKRSGKARATTYEAR